MAVAEDKFNTLGIVTIGVASALLLWASIVALQAYYEATFGEEVQRKQTAGMDDELRALRAEQRQRVAQYRRNEDGETVRVPIERARDLVLAELAGPEPDTLVPAVGPHDDGGVVPSEWGTPIDEADEAEEDEAEEDEAEADEAEADEAEADEAEPDEGEGADGEGEGADGGEGTEGAARPGAEAGAPGAPEAQEEGGLEPPQAEGEPEDGDRQPAPEGGDSEPVTED